MRRWWVSLALLVSLGINLGLLGAVAAGRWEDRAEGAADPAPMPAAATEPSRERLGGISVEVPEPGPGAQRPHDGRGRHGLDRHGPDRRPGEPPLDRLADHLGLEGERRERFVALQREFLATHLEARRERFRLGGELRRELVAEAPDRERVEELLARLGEVHAESERATAEVILASRELLDDDQRETYFRFLERLREGRGPGGRGHAGRRAPR